MCIYIYIYMCVCVYVLSSSFLGYWLSCSKSPVSGIRKRGLEDLSTGGLEEIREGEGCEGLLSGSASSSAFLWCSSNVESRDGKVEGGCVSVSLCLCVCIYACNHNMTTSAFASRSSHRLPSSKHIRQTYSNTDWASPFLPYPALNFAIVKTFPSLSIRRRIRGNIQPCRPEFP